MRWAYEGGGHAVRVMISGYAICLQLTALDSHKNVVRIVCNSVWLWLCQASLSMWQQCCSGSQCLAEIRQGLTG